LVASTGGVTGWRRSTASRQVMKLTEPMMIAPPRMTKPSSGSAKISAPRSAAQISCRKVDGLGDGDRRGGEGAGHGVVPGGREEGDEEEPERVLEARRHPDRQREGREADRDRDREDRDDERGRDLPRHALGDEIGAGEAERGEEHRDMARRDLADAGAQDDQRAEERRDDGGDAAEGEPLAEEDRGAERDVDRLEVVHRGDLDDRDLGHGVEPGDHRAGVQRAAQAVEAPEPRRQAQAGERGQRGSRKAKPSR
jgi:hypothetical protein